MIRKPLFALLAWGFSACAAEVVGGPYVVNVTQRAATIAWIEKEGEVRAGESAADLTRAIPVLKSKKVSLTGLKAGSTVHYSAWGTEEGSGSFKTAAPAGGAFKFVVFGDTRTRHDMHKRVASAIAQHRPDFVVHTGDLVADGVDTLQWPVFFGIERELLRHAPIFPVLGNHERNNRQFYEFFDIKSPYYSFDWGDVHFSMLNTDMGNIAATQLQRERFWAEQSQWLEQDIARSKAKFKIVVMHHPPFTAYQVASHMSKEAPMLVPMFEKYNVAAVFSGHDHNYQHHLKNGVRYFVSGGGGAPLNKVDSPIPGMTQKVESTEHFVSIEVNGDAASVRAIGLDGRLIDEVVIAAR
jgi:3',5'-cyclic AMP phosphodiesterase CpdA